ncbi:MAG: glycoside hydrolase family 3 N-terminal domain-containing protein [Anaeromyxobacteraceae bacterium]
MPRPPRATSRLLLLFALGAALAACDGPGRHGPAHPRCPGDEACETVCVDHGDCPAGFGCETGLCAPLPAGRCERAADCAADEQCVEQACGGTTEGPCLELRCVPECDLAPNLVRVSELASAQPALVVDPGSGKTVITVRRTFASEAGNPAVLCGVGLKFKDLSGDGALQPYEDWTLTTDERVTDLASRLGPSGLRALLAHPVLSDVPSSSSLLPNEATRALVDAGVRAGQTAATSSTPFSRRSWANYLQARCEAAPLGVPFLLSSAPAHVDGEGRVRSPGFTAWPPELAIAASFDQGRASAFGKYTALELRAIGVRLVVSHAGNLATDPRWPGVPWTFGEDLATTTGFAGAYVEGAQGTTLGRTSLAVVLAGYRGAGAARGGLDARLSKGRYTAYDGNRFEAHAAAFCTGAAGLMPGYAIPAYGTWGTLADPLLGQKIQQAGASFNAQLLGRHSGLVLAPPGAIEDAGLAPFGAPWGVEALTRPQRIAQAVGAGVDQFLGLASLTAIDDAHLSEAQVAGAARKVLRLMFQLGLFEVPYADPDAWIGSYAAREEALRAMYGGMVLLRNVPKPAGWLNGGGDGTQTGDHRNAGNGTLRVLPAPVGMEYMGTGRPTWFYVAGDFDLDWVDSVSAGYGVLVNRVPTLASLTEAEKMAASDYVLVRIRAPWALDPDSGPFALPTPSLTYAGTDPSWLAPVAAARAALDAHPDSKAQLVVIVDAGRPPVVSEVLAYAPSALYVSWSGARPANPDGDKAALDVIFGVVSGTGKLPVALPASDEAAAAQLSDVPGDGADATFVRGYGLETQHF